MRTQKKKIGFVFATAFLVSMGLSLFQFGQGISCDGCNIVIISSEPIRKDHLGVYGYHRNTSPNIDRFAQEAIVFEDAYGHSPHTLMSTISMLTSLYPNQHRVPSNANTAEKRSFDKLTFVDSLAENGYYTRAIHEGNTGLDTFDLGFDERSRSTGYKTSTDLERLFSELKSEGRFLLFYQFYSGHLPYTTEVNDSSGLNLTDKSYRAWSRKNYNRIFENDSLTDSEKWETANEFFYSRFENSSYLRNQAIAGYDSQLRRGDDRVGRVLQALKEEDLKDETIVVFMSEHGESLGEHGEWGHGSLYNEVIQVPLILRVPGEEAREVGDTVELVSLGPTLLDIVGVEGGRFSQQSASKTLIPNMMGEGQGEDVIANYPVSLQKVFIDASRNLKYYQVLYDHRAYNLTADPEENKRIENGEILRVLRNQYIRKKGDGSVETIRPWPYGLEKQ